MPGRTKIRGGSCGVDIEVNEFGFRYHDRDSNYFEVTVSNSDGSSGGGFWGELKKDAVVELKWKEKKDDLDDSSPDSEKVLT